MRQLRHLAVVSTVLSGALVVACTTANPGWTYEPAPSTTPAPSVEASAVPSASNASGAVAISAQNIAFDPTTVTVRAGKPFQIAFANNDAGVPHNIAIHKGDAGGAEAFKGEIFPGVATKTYDVPALDAGTYAFVCTVHPNMVGTMTTQ